MSGIPIPIGANVLFRWMVADMSRMAPLLTAGCPPGLSVMPLLLILPFFRLVALRLSQSASGCHYCNYLPMLLLSRFVTCVHICIGLILA